MATRLPSGMYRAQVLLGTDEHGKRIYRSFVAETADEADYEALTFKLGKGQRVNRPITLRTAMDAYISSKEGVLSPATIHGYRKVLRCFGSYLDIKLHDINALNLQTAISAYARTGREDGKGTISPKTVRNAYGLISAVLRQNGLRHVEIENRQGECRADFRK